VAENPDVECLNKKVTTGALPGKSIWMLLPMSRLDDSLDLEGALEEALRLGCINIAADLVNQASQMEQTIAKLYTTWKKNWQSGRSIVCGYGAVHQSAITFRLPRTPCW